ncbi:glycoside hydrolase family 81 protein [Coleophoma crateriformis]|uniref:glucan endo-1,3-beta-D-glucosidase n=1 Tax=Coleophoma crateriformis TaxID=565419 RepID=A0A3D8T7T0_9HELO|nr:glycoside hydrolase family 81 protein [Coleophoma crateriformis]
MKLLYSLIFLQVLAANAIPHRHRRRQDASECSAASSNAPALHISGTISTSLNQVGASNPTSVAVVATFEDAPPVSGQSAFPNSAKTSDINDDDLIAAAFSEPGEGVAFEETLVYYNGKSPTSTMTAPAQNTVRSTRVTCQTVQATPPNTAQAAAPSSTDATVVSGNNSASENSAASGRTTASGGILESGNSAAVLASAGGIFLASMQTSTVIRSVSVLVTSTHSGTAQVLPTLSGQTPATTGSVITSIGSIGTSGPLLQTSILAPSKLLSATARAVSQTTSIAVTPVSNDIFQPVATTMPPSVINSRSDHPLPRLGITAQDTPIGTNKFYANFFLGTQTAGTWTHPYSVAWSKGGGASTSWGMSIQHIDADQRVYGPNPSANPVEYFIDPIGIQSIVLSAVELGSSTSLTIDTMTAFSANVNLLPSPGAEPAITFPLVQGMGFITAIYNGGTPILQSGVFFRTVTRANTSPKAGVTKYTIVLEDGKTWLVYASSPSGATLSFIVVSNGLVQATSNWDGIIQVAKNPGGEAEAIYDAACGTYATSAALSGSASGTTGTYSLSFSKAGFGSTLLMFALPHHIQSFSASGTNSVTTLTSLQLNTTTKGIATGVIADTWTFTENLPTSMGFAPWSPSSGSQSALSSATISTILSVAKSEVSQNMTSQTDLNSMYYSGKALAKFAGIIYTINDLLNDQALAQAGLADLKQSFALFTSNEQQFPLVHDTAWGGIVSSASYTTGDSGVDFGNSYYNDHHFHYGYFVYAAAVIGYLDPTWLTTENVAWVNALVRDYANPSTLDTYFPVSRNFDWYHGHSWAHGLFETFDGKDEESSSEDTMSAYAIKMWGHTIGDANMEARGNLQLAVSARALQNYFLYTSSNTVEPARFIGNKVSGIMFENKIDHTTYFGTNIEYIQGIHMIPLMPFSTLTRSQEFVTEEWNTYFSNGRADSVSGGWRGILYANLAIVQPMAAWTFFSQSGFDSTWLDGGASQTWYMALAAGLGGTT